MSLLILKNIRIENTNAISGFTYGFPSVTHFLGFVHALSRQLSQSHQLTFHGCAILCHDYQVHAYRKDNFTDYTFALTRNPLTKEGKTAPIIEEGKMHLTISLMIECEGHIAGNSEQDKLLSEDIRQLALHHRLAGGRIIDIRRAYFKDSPTDDTGCRKLLRPLLPGFILIDRSEYLQKHMLDSQQDMLSSWLDFSSLKYTYQHNDESKDQAKWQAVAKPQKGYLVPLAIGYKQLSPAYEAGQVADVRDPNSPFAFVESIHSIGEWIGSPSRIESLEQILWRYDYQSPYYLCRTARQLTEAEQFDFSQFNDY